MNETNNERVISVGLRFRKSVNIGPFRLNFSKSGIGWSIGGKVYRFTKKVGGGYRQTYNIPGTGISYVEDYKESSLKKKEEIKPEAATTHKWSLMRIIKLSALFVCTIFCVIMLIGGILAVTSQPSASGVDVALIFIFGLLTIGFTFVFCKTCKK